MGSLRFVVLYGLGLAVLEFRVEGGGAQAITTTVLFWCSLFIAWYALEVSHAASGSP